MSGRKLKLNFTFEWNLNMNIENQIGRDMEIKVSM